MFIEPHLIVSAGVSLYEHRKTLSEAFRRLGYRLRHGRLELVTFGAGGVGKSTFGRFVANPNDRAIREAKYKDSIGMEQFGVPGPISARLIVPPGQERRRKQDWPRLFTIMEREKKAFGVINVVAYGYHSLDQEIAEDVIAHNAAPTPRNLQSFVKKNRLSEVEALKQIVPHLKNARELAWMITLVTKQDLWWNERGTVEDHYTKGSYSTLIKEVATHRGANFKHEFLSASIVINNFATIDGKIVAPTNAGYDQVLQMAHQEKLIETLTTFMKEGVHGVTS